VTSIRTAIISTFIRIFRPNRNVLGRTHIYGHGTVSLFLMKHGK
jgi:hypothetical protein